jgi:hypothetical protein
MPHVGHAACARLLGTYVQPAEIQYHHEVYTQYLWKVIWRMRQLAAEAAARNAVLRANGDGWTEG